MIFAFFSAFVSGLFAAFAVTATNIPDKVSGVLIALVSGLAACGIYYVFWESRDEK